mgnify:CR=1 FL=1
MQIFRLATLFLLLMVLPASAENKGPQLQIEQPDFPFGEILQGDRVNHVFTFTNTGDQTLVVSKVKSSCGCTAALLSEREIQAGQQGEVRVSFNSTRFRGKVSKTVYLYTNDPANRMQQLHLRGMVKVEVDVVPAQLRLGPVKAGQTIDGIIRIINRSGEELEVRELKPTMNNVDLSLQGGTVQPGETLEVTISMKTAPGESRRNGYVLGKTDNPRQPELRIPVFLTVQP